MVESKYNIRERASDMPDKTIKLPKIKLNDEELKFRCNVGKQLENLLRMVSYIENDLYDPILDNIDEYTNEELENILNIISPGFHRSEIRGEIRKRNELLKDDDNAERN